MGGGMIRIVAPAKVNLFLRVLAREESGFHQLETLFQALELGDELVLQPGGDDISLDLGNTWMGPPEENLVYRAARTFLDATGIRTGVEIHLEKRIPVQAGLGGGSSDAAAVLRAMNILFPDRLDWHDLLTLAGELGSDVPFFLAPSPLALAWGRGQRLLPLPPLPRLPVVVAAPPEGVDTGEAYRLLARERGTGKVVPGPEICRVEALSHWESVAEMAENDFEAVILPAHPLLEKIRSSMAGAGSLFARLSGSGSALFAAFMAQEDAATARERLAMEFPHTRFFLTHTLETFPEAFSRPGVES